MRVADELKHTIQGYIGEMAKALTVEHSDSCGEDGMCLDCWLANRLAKHEMMKTTYYSGAEMEYIGAELLIEVGGPDVWINTRTKRIVGYNCGRRVSLPIPDEICKGIDRWASELHRYWCCQ